MDKEFAKLIQYAEKNGYTVKFVDSRTLHDYAGMNADAAKDISFTNIEANEIELDRTLPEDTQYKNLKHELTEKKLMDSGIVYWKAHLQALKAEEEPFDYSKSMYVSNTIPFKKPKRMLKKKKHRVNKLTGFSF